jgi:hypothetical protein
VRSDTYTQFFEHRVGSGSRKVWQPQVRQWLLMTNQNLRNALKIYGKYLFDNASSVSWLQLHPEDAGSMITWNFGIQSHHYTVSQPTRADMKCAITVMCTTSVTNSIETLSIASEMKHRTDGRTDPISPYKLSERNTSKAQNSARTRSQLRWNLNFN